MKVPFRYQASEYDCVPTTLLNALSFLFERDEIPPLVVQRIYLYCLDTLGPGGYVGQGGTSGFAIKFIAEWLNEYKHRDFRVSAEYLEGSDVHLRQRNKISKCINQGGVAAVSVTHEGEDTHYILVLGVRAGWLHCFDPYLLRKNGKAWKGQGAESYKFVEPSGPHGPNLYIKRPWFRVKSDKRVFRLGVMSRRQCLLLRRLGG